VQWNQANYPPAIRTFANTSAPTLPLADSCFDLVTAYSVFTHIAETETQWLLELRRILKIGGIAYLSFHDEARGSRRGSGAWERSPWDFHSTHRCRPARPSRAGVRTIPYNCNVFHAADHIQRVWGRYFDILQIKPRWVGAQAVAVCRRPG
jgi:SAM-dependent methyltransferase